MVRLLCVEDDPLMRAYLNTRLDLEPDFRVVGTVEGAGAALRLLRRGDPQVDVVLLDYRLIGSDGLELLEALAHGGDAWAPAFPRVLFCTGHTDPAFEDEARDRGASGVVTKDRLSTELLPAIRAVAGGSSWFHMREAPMPIGAGR